MEIEIISATANPLDVIAIAAGTSYGKSDAKHSRVKNVFSAGHMSCFEHASVTFRVSGISRCCSHQLVRHRLASYVQKSQRYTKVDWKNTDWYVMPPSFTGVNKIKFEVEMEAMAEAYSEALEAGIKPEDARYLLPEATKTEITCTMNVRTLFHFLNLRTDSHAQWEIRDMANELWQEIARIDEQWGELIGMWTTGTVAE